MSFYDLWTVWDQLYKSMRFIPEAHELLWVYVHLKVTYFLIYVYGAEEKMSAIEWQSLSHDRWDRAVFTWIGWNDNELLPVVNAFNGRM